jgi:hypothetical protein
MRNRRAAGRPGPHPYAGRVRLPDGPVYSVNAQLVTRKPPTDPTDMLPAMFRCTSGATGLLATLRSTPSYRRVYVFGPAGSAEALGDTELVIRRSGKSARRIAPGDSLRAELDAFAGRAAYPITSNEMLGNLSRHSSRGSRQRIRPSV